MKTTILATILFLSLSLSAGAQMYVYPGGTLDGQDKFTYVGTTDVNITVAWDVPEGGADYYEVELYSVNRNAVVAKGRTVQPSLSFTSPYQGLFIVRIRAANENPDGDDLYSPWVSSDDPNTGQVNGVQRGWWIYTFLAPPGPIQ